MEKSASKPNRSGAHDPAYRRWVKVVRNPSPPWVMLVREPLPGWVMVVRNDTEITRTISGSRVRRRTILSYESLMSGSLIAFGNSGFM